MKAFIILCAAIMMASSAYGEDCFPGTKDAISPKQQFRITWQEPKDENTPHTLLFQRKHGVASQSFFKFERYVCLHWSPTEKYFSITDHQGSDVSTVWIYSVVSLKKVLDIREILPETLKELVKRNHHTYLEVTSWQTDGLRVHVWGYGDGSPDGFEMTINCMMNSKWTCHELQ